MVLVVSEEVRDAVDARRPVVALESTIISHGLPRPRNLQVALELEAVVRAEGAVPATIAVLDGRPHVGLDKEQLDRVANEDGFRKLGHRDLPLAVASGASGATTVSATALLAALAGVRVFATGGLGGVHREWTVTQDESADLGLLASTRITVVCAGVKSILDVAGDPPAAGDAGRRRHAATTPKASRGSTSPTRGIPWTGRCGLRGRWPM